MGRIWTQKNQTQIHKFQFFKHKSLIIQHQINQSINSIYEIQKSIFQFLGHNYVQQRTQKAKINNKFFKQIPPLILSLSLSLYASLFQVDVETDVVVAAVGQSKKRTFKKFSFRGVDLDALIDMYTDKHIKL